MNIARAALALSLLLPTPALACGGLFCSSATLQAVEQAKERILFEVRDGEVISHVEIRYSGNPREFSWVVPIPETPTVDIAPASTLRLLDLATAPSIIPPNIDWTDRFDSDPFSGGDDDDAADDDDATDDDDFSPPPVDVIDLPVVGPFDPEVISSDDPEALIDWLTDNGYLITEAMEPLVAGYVEAGMKFLGMKMVPNADVQDIAPVRIAYRGGSPSIPLRLTAVGAEPGLQLAVFFVGDSAWAPRDWGLVEPNAEQLRADPRNGDNNYQPWLAWQFDQFGGRAFALEYSDSRVFTAARIQSQPLAVSDRDEAEDYLRGILSDGSWLTRLYTTIDPAEMLDDPTFVETGVQLAVGQVHNLRDQQPVYWDQDINPPLACNDLYCGAMGRCAVTDEPWELEGCLCDAGSLARRVETPQLGQALPMESVACVDAFFDPVGELPTEAGDACADYACGYGECVVLAGKATCDCQPGMAAVNWGSGLRCQPAIDVYEPEQLEWPCFNAQPGDAPCLDARVGAGDEGPDGLTADCDGCSAASTDRSHRLAFLLLLGLFARRRPRNKCA